MSFLSIAGSGAAKTMIMVTVSLHPGAAHQGSHVTTVRAGDTLSSISQQAYGKAGNWPAVWWANRHSVRNPSMIQPGERLRLPSPNRVERLNSEALTAVPAPAHAAVPVATPVSTPASGDAVTSAAPTQVTATYSGSGGFQSCVIQAESGGDAGAVNGSSGAGGLYGFLPSTWQSLGYSGLPENAPVSEQNAAFAKEYAQSGSAAWSAYDGC